MIVVGLGSGRSGTASLAHLLNSQKDAICFHEMNPSCVRFSGTPRPILNTIEEFQAILDGGDASRLTVDLGREVAAQTYDQLVQLNKVSLIGDIAFYYLSYVEEITQHNPNVRFVCLKRNRTETVESWLKKSRVNRWRSKKIADRLSSWITRQPYHESKNFWMDHDGRHWQLDPIWDKCFPKFSAPDKRSAIEQYWDYYYEEADKLAHRYPECFKIVDTPDLKSSDFQAELLSFCGVSTSEQVYTDAHKHKSMN